MDDVLVCGHKGGALPLPACGERVGVRGICVGGVLSKVPLTRRASRVDLSPQAGRGKKDQLAVNVSSPADSSASSVVTSPSCSPANSSEVTWNSPATVPKSGITIWKLFTAPSKKVWRISASDDASLNRPRPATAARL